MKKSKYILVLLLFISIFITPSCEKHDADTEKPVITISGPKENDTLYIGSGVHFEADFSDNIALKSYKIDIHNNFDGHSHKSILTDDSIAFSFQKSWNFDEGLKNAHIHHHEIEIPNEIDNKPIKPGAYHFMVYCTDAAGNESWTAIAVKILKSEDKTPPSFSNIIAPSNNQVFSNGQTISITGTISDNDALHGLFVAIMPQSATNEQVNPNDCFAVMLHEHEVVDGQKSYNFNASIMVGQSQDNNNPPKSITWTTGNYFIIVKGVDESGNIAFSNKYSIIFE